MRIHVLTLDSLQVGSIYAQEALFDWSRKIPEAEVLAAQKFTNPKRKDEFLKGRLILHYLDRNLPPVLQSAQGMPCWPEGRVGSISHKEGLVVATVQDASHLQSIGIDIEESSLVSLQIAGAICRQEELEFLELIPENEKKREALTIIFSGKESLFKCCYQICQIWFGFKDAVVTLIDHPQNRFQIKLQRELSPDFTIGKTFNGTFQWLNFGNRKFILTCVTYAR